mmetsp:Transcript_20358/g.56801  ORF Transcript_20358/g.56801 Transcript_20358/m.56801 type:complete len:208 (-) Transcript_20358:244-867(-)
MSVRTSPTTFVLSWEVQQGRRRPPHRRRSPSASGEPLRHMLRPMQTARPGRTVWCRTCAVTRPGDNSCSEVKVLWTRLSGDWLTRFAPVARTSRSLLLRADRPPPRLPAARCRLQKQRLRRRRRRLCGRPCLAAPHRPMPPRPPWPSRGRLQRCPCPRNPPCSETICGRYRRRVLGQRAATNASQHTSRSESVRPRGWRAGSRPGRT